MSITKQNVHKHELIGMYVKVIESRDTNHTDLNGQIVNETKNTFSIETSEGEKILQKDGLVMRTKLHDSFVLIHGSKIKFRPEDRIKRVGKVN